MRHLVFLTTFAIAANLCHAQENKTITVNLRNHFSEAIYHNDNGGWYSVRAGGRNCTACRGAFDRNANEIVPAIYDQVVGFVTAGLFQVRLNGKFYAVPVSDKQQAVQSGSGFSEFARKYVEPKINEWQLKGEFETTVAWQQRVNEDTRRQMINKFAHEAQELFIVQQSQNIRFDLSLGQYDADNETFLVTDRLSQKEMLVHVPLSHAPNFRSSWMLVQRMPQYTIENDDIALAEIDFKLPNGEEYKYSERASLSYAVAQIDYDFDPIDINLKDALSLPKGEQNIIRSDVAINIPHNDVTNDKTFAVIIANENYRRESQVEFAKNDGETFRRYCIQTLGLPANNVHFTAEATLNDMRGEVNWLNNVANAYKGEANIIFYYAGHGIPDQRADQRGVSYLLPVDGFGSDVSTGYKLDDLYQRLGEMPAKGVTVFLDACFSGAQRSGEMMASARGVAIKAVQGAPSGNMVVFSAAQEDQAAFPYREKGHGLFTYFLLKKLQETKGEVTLGELGDYITTNVHQQSAVTNKNQTPVVTPSPALGTNWKNRKLK